MRASASLERVIEEQAFPVRGGVFVAVAGPSGAGKDSVMNFARERLEGKDNDIVFVRRIITRAHDGGGEAHDCLSEAAFEAARKAGAFSVHWKANGLSYALPASVDEVVRSGRVAVANISRSIVPILRERYANLRVVMVTARPEILAERLLARGRENREEITRRLARADSGELAVKDALEIDNSGSLQEAGERLQDVLRRAIAWSAVSDSV